MTAEGRVLEVARAKVNLHLHVVGRRSDGMHLLDSLVVFPEVGDGLEARPARELSLTVSGPAGDQLDAGSGNLVLRAAEALRAAAGRLDLGAALMLDKNLPVASGIGGGSADAAAALRALTRLWSLTLPGERLAEIALELGADVPVCLGAPGPRLMAGVGERLTPAPALPEIWMVLANPGVEVATAAVFRALDGAFGAPARMPDRFAGAAGLAAWLATTRNDLAAPAESLAPEIATTREALSASEGCLFARMSGSGATCYGIFEEEGPARAAADGLAADGLWAVAAPVRGGA